MSSHKKTTYELTPIGPASADRGELPGAAATITRWRLDETRKQH